MSDRDNVRNASPNRSCCLPIDQENGFASATNNSVFALALGGTKLDSGRNSPPGRNSSTRPGFTRSISVPAADIPPTLNNTGQWIGDVVLRAPSPDNIIGRIVTGPPILN
jgi:hypothetical protein